MTLAEKVQIGIRCCKFGYNSPQQCDNCPYLKEVEPEICSIVLRRDLDKVLSAKIEQEKSQIEIV